jgi:hypothetical protein
MADINSKTHFNFTSPELIGAILLLGAMVGGWFDITNKQSRQAEILAQIQRAQSARNTQIAEIHDWRIKTMEELRSIQERLDACLAKSKR